MKLVVLILICYISYVVSERWIDYRYVSRRLQARNGTDKNETTEVPPLKSYCKITGYNCAGCDKVIFCYSLNREWYVDNDSTYKCETGFCNKGECTAQVPIDCTIGKDVNKCGATEGMYPDPTSCKKFSYCLPNSAGKSPTSSECGKDYAYNARTTYCDKKITNNTCTGSPVPECIIPGQTGPLAENPTIYYMCRPIAGWPSRSLFPYLNACPNGLKYDSNTLACKS